MPKTQKLEQANSLDAAELNAHTLWSNILMRKQKERIIKKQSKDVIPMLKEILDDAEGYDLYNNTEEKRALGEALLKIINKEREEIRSKHREKRHQEVRSKLAKVTHLLEDKEEEDDGPLYRLADKASKLIPLKTQLMLLKEGEEVTEKNQKKIQAYLKKLGISVSNEDFKEFYEGLYWEMDFQNSERADLKESKNEAWHKENKKTVDEIKETSDKNERLKKQVSLIMHQLNTGPQFEKHEKEAIKRTLMYLLEGEIHGRRKISSNLSIKTTKQAKSAAFTIFERLKGNTDIARGVLNSLKKELERKEIKTRKTTVLRNNPQRKSFDAWHAENDKKILEISKMPNRIVEDIPKKSKANAELILHQINTGPKFSIEERSAIKDTLIVLLAKHVHGITLEKPPYASKELQAVAEQIFKRLKKNNSIAIALLEAIKAELLPTEKGSSVEQKAEKTFMDQENTRKSFMNPKPSIDWTGVDRETHGKKSSPIDSSAKPSIEFPEYVSLSKQQEQKLFELGLTENFKKAEQALEPALSLKGQYRSATQQAAVLINKIKEAPQNATSADFKELKKYLSKSREIIPAINAAKIAAESGLESLREDLIRTKIIGINKPTEDELFILNKYKDLQLHIDTLNKPSYGTVKSLQEDWGNLNDDVQRVSKNIILDGQYFAVGSTLDYYSERKDRTVEAEIMGISAEKVMLQTNHPNGKQKVFFTISRENAQKRLSIPKKEKRSPNNTQIFRKTA